MKKVIAAMAVMFFVVVILGSVWSMMFRPLIGGGTEQSFIYPIYVGLILLAGLIVGTAVVICEEIEKLRKEIKSDREEAEKPKKE